MPPIDTTDDRSLVAAAQAGDRRSLDILLRRHYDKVHAICRRIAGSSRDADDAAQEAMISIVRGLERARAWYDSPMYVEARAARQGAATGSLIAVEGL